MMGFINFGEIPLPKQIRKFKDIILNLLADWLTDICPPLALKHIYNPNININKDWVTFKSSHLHLLHLSK